MRLKIKERFECAKMYYIDNNNKLVSQTQNNLFIFYSIAYFQGK